ncbi:MAG: AMIN domain-containing protein, partial [Bdellovibrio sp.]
MKGFIRFFILSALTASILSCASNPVEDDLSLDDTDPSSSSEMEMAAGDSSAGTDSGSGDDFADFENSASEETSVADSSSPAPAENGDSSLDQELSLSEEGHEAPQQQAQQAAPPVEDLSPAEDPFADNSVADVPAPVEPQEMDVPAPVVTETLPEVPEAPFEAPTQVATSNGLATITDLQYKANDSGGTIVVRSDRPVAYTTRMNPDLHQFIIEVENAHLPDRLKRSLNTRDIKGSIGAVDGYQNPGSSTARFVIQLREGVMEPAVQAEGNNLLIVANGAGSSIAETPVVPSPETGEVIAQDGSVDTNVDLNDAKILPSQNLTEFLSGNTKFYGKKISLETNNMDIRDALSFITEESGVNMVVAEEVKGSVSLKLRQVPWDQALVVIMKAKKLGYTRQGNVLRIAPLQDLKAEEDDATKLAQARKNLEPLKVRMFPVSYAKVDELEKKIKDFLGERGKAVGDVR